jgi:hypothetical protein
MYRRLRHPSLSFSLRAPAAGPVGSIITQERPSESRHPVKARFVALSCRSLVLSVPCPVGPLSCRSLVLSVKTGKTGTTGRATPPKGPPVRTFPVRESSPPAGRTAALRDERRRGRPLVSAQRQRPQLPDSGDARQDEPSMRDQRSPAASARASSAMRKAVHAVRRAPGVPDPYDWPRV